MPVYASTMIFNQGKHGWSETWYQTVSTHAQALGALINLSTKRSLLLGTNAGIEYLRVSDVSVPFDAEVTVTGTDVIVQPTFCDTPWNAIYCRVNAGPKYRRQVWLRGIPDVWILFNANNISPLNPILEQVFRNFRQSLISNGFQLRVIDKEGFAGVPLDVTAMAVAGDYISYNVPGVAGVKVGEMVRIAKTTGPDRKKLNGRRKIRAIAGTVLTLDVKADDIADLGANIPGEFWYQKIAYKNVESGSVIRPAKRDTGRAFFVSAGRRPASR